MSMLATVSVGVPAKPQEQIKGSIVKGKYREQYRKNGYSCGDDLADELRAYLEVRIGGKATINLELLRKVADDNKVWKATYANLNPGQRRMTIGNCLRNKYKNGDKLDIGGVILFDPELQIEE